MFNMTKIRAVNGAGKAFYHNHLSSNDYYSEKEKVVGHWFGELAEKFGLVGREVDMETFSLFQRNVNPLTMDKLTYRTVANGVRFFDFQVAAPKSVSIMSMFDECLVMAHKDSVRAAMRELERLAAVRLRKGDQVRTNNFETTGRLIYAEFTHDTSRALDPQLHTHNVVCNVSVTDDGEHKALESLEMVRAIRYAGKVYHNAMAAKCHELGYETVDRRDERGNIVWYDIKGVSEEIMERFSKRRAQIEALEKKFIEEHGRKPTLNENNYLSVSTRTDKMLDSSLEEVSAYQRNQLSREEQSVLKRLAEASYYRVDMGTMGTERTIESIRKVIPLIYERESVVKLDKVLAETLNQNLGRIDLAVLKQAVKEVPELKNLGGTEVNPYYSPQEVIERELYAIESVEGQRGIFAAAAPDFAAFPGQETRRTQAELIHGMLKSQDRFQLFRGVAGAGKTSTLQEFCKGLRSGGVESIYLVAPTNSATDVLKQEGFEQSQTVAGFLLSPEKPPAGSYVIIDESGLNSLSEGAEIIKAARANNYRVLFVGDARQHTAVASGDFFRLLEDYSQIEKFSLTDIHRQQNEEYRRGIMECAMGQFDQAFERFDANRFIHEGKADYLKNAARSYMEFTENGQYIDRAILVAPTHDEGDRLTAAVREKLKEAGAVAPEGHTRQVFRSWNREKAWIRDAGNYYPGTVVAFIRNMKGIARAGETATVNSVENGMLHLDNGKQVHAKRAADFIEIGEFREIELCRGDLIQFNVNLREQKIYNGNIAQVTDDPRKVMMLYPDGKPRGLVELPEDYAAFKHGWVTTSYKSQGRTADNVVVAAQGMDRKAFYVALSRGRRQMALHCPDKDFLKDQLNFRRGDRVSIHDLIRDREIPPNAVLPLSPETRNVKAATLPDFSYKSIAERLKRFAVKVGNTVQQVLGFGQRIRQRREHDARLKFGIIDSQTPLPIEKEHAVELRETRDDTPKKDFSATKYQRKDFSRHGNQRKEPDPIAAAPQEVPKLPETPKLSHEVLLARYKFALRRLNWAMEEGRTVKSDYGVIFTGGDLGKALRPPPEKMSSRESSFWFYADMLDGGLQGIAMPEWLIAQYLADHPDNQLKAKLEVALEKLMPTLTEKPEPPVQAEIPQREAVPPPRKEKPLPVSPEVKNRVPFSQAEAIRTDKRYLELKRLWVESENASAEKMSLPELRELYEFEAKIRAADKSAPAADPDAASRFEQISSAPVYQWLKEKSDELAGELSSRDHDHLAFYEKKEKAALAEVLVSMEPSSGISTEARPVPDRTPAVPPVQAKTSAPQSQADMIRTDKRYLELKRLWTESGSASTEKMGLPELRELYEFEAKIRIADKSAPVADPKAASRLEEIRSGYVYQCLKGKSAELNGELSSFDRDHLVFYEKKEKVALAEVLTSMDPSSGISTESRQVPDRTPAVPPVRKKISTPQSQLEELRANRHYQNLKRVWENLRTAPGGPANKMDLTMLRELYDFELKISALDKSAPIVDPKALSKLERVKSNPFYVRMKKKFEEANGKLSSSDREQMKFCDIAEKAALAEALAGIYHSPGVETASKPVPDRAPAILAAPKTAAPPAREKTSAPLVQKKVLVNQPEIDRIRANERYQNLKKTWDSFETSNDRILKMNLGEMSELHRFEEKISEFRGISPINSSSPSELEEVRSNRHYQRLKERHEFGRTMAWDERYKLQGFEIEEKMALVAELRSMWKAPSPEMAIAPDTPSKSGHAQELEMPKLYEGRQRERAFQERLGQARARDQEKKKKPNRGMDL
jgi:conjugative relaxase-like TrwC/TraI family protein